MKAKKVSIIGSGFASISAACYLANAGYHVEVYEKNEQLGGRARQLSKEGFLFDMGPTWYWMPDVFERFFADFGKRPDDYYQLEKLNPAYRVYFGKEDFLDIGGSVDEIREVFERQEPGSGRALDKFLRKSKKNYDIAIKDLVYQPGESPLELVRADTAMELPQFVSTIHDVVRKRFQDQKLRQILEFPVLFLGAKPSMTPAFYSFMNYADFGLGTWYPKGGMRSVVTGMVQLAEELGVKFHTRMDVQGIEVGKGGEVKGLRIDDRVLPAELLVSGADYHHTEQLLPRQSRQYSDKYWSKRVMAPSSLLFYVGFSRKLKNVKHHTLFFDVPFDAHAREIYDTPSWPEKPLFYASFPSITDAGVAPSGKEAAVFLIPLATDLVDTSEIRQKYFDLILERLEKITQQELRPYVEFSESYCVNDFKKDYNSLGGNAYGMANTLMQTAFLRPKLRSRKVKNLYFTGQLTVPGPGVPPSLISGKLVAELLTKNNER